MLVTLNANLCTANGMEVFLNLVVQILNEGIWLALSNLAV